MTAQRAITHLRNLDDVNGIRAYGVGPIWDGAQFTFTDLNAQAQADGYSVGFPYTAHPNYCTSSITLNANQCWYLRVFGGGWVSAIGLNVKVQAGNIGVAVYRNMGRGRHARPLYRAATSGAVSCPAAGYREIALGSTVYVNPGDWLALWGDNGSIKVLGATASADLGSDIYASTGQGLGMLESPVTGAPPYNPNPTHAGASSVYLLVGIPPANRQVALAPAGWEGTALQEPTVWWDGSQWNMIYSGNWGASEALGWATSPSLPGVGLWARQGTQILPHATCNGRANVFIDTDGTFYLYFPDSSGDLGCATGSPTDLTVHTGVFSPTGRDPATSIQNSTVINDNGVYRMLFEAVKDASFQTGSAHASNPLGPWTQDTFPLSTLRVASDAGGGMYGGPWLTKQGSTYINWYHACPFPASGAPTDIYRATSQDFVTWTHDASPRIAREINPPEFDQVTDPCLVTDPATGLVYCFWAGVNNGTQAASIMVNLPAYLPLAL